MQKDTKICVIGHKGLLGHAICQNLHDHGFENVIGCDLPEVDLCEQAQVKEFFEKERPGIVFFLAAVAGGIKFKQAHAVEMMQQNLEIIANVFRFAYMYGCKEMVYVCSALLYPSAAPIPYREEDAVSSDLGTIDACYSLAKAAGMQLASYYNNQYGTKYLTVVPCNFFGAHAIFTGEKAGVVPSLINRMHEAKKNGAPQVEIWGTGNACREFLNSKDVADACVYLIQQPMKYSLINIGRGEEYPIRDIAYIIKKVIGYEGKLVFDASKPEGRPHMQLDTTRLRGMGWTAKMTMEESIRDAYDWYRSQHKEVVKKP